MTNETVTERIFDLTPDEIFDFLPKLKPFHWAGFFYVICVTFNVPPIRMNSTGSAVKLPQYVN